MFLTDKRIGEGGREDPEAATYLKNKDFIWKSTLLLFMAAKITIHIQLNINQRNVVLSPRRERSRLSAAANSFAAQELGATNKLPVSSPLLPTTLWAAGELAAVTSNLHCCCL